MIKSFIIIHIPHSSSKVPLILKKQIKDKNTFIIEKKKLTDWYIDKLYKKCNTNKLIFKYTRFFCDVERFKDEKKEPMASKGMGVIYDTFSNKTKFLNPSAEYKEKVYKIYDKHHKKFDNLVCKILKKYNKCLIIDAHSFAEESVLTINGAINTPDICIGIDKDFEDKKITKLVVNHFKKNNFSIMINYPYVGSIVPNKYYKLKDKRVKTIMIEINKRVYMNNGKIDKDRFIHLKTVITELINIIK
ncbi:MAG: N-formylglutamate amidohydrolase [bacterium]|nr:N-formylglutamate amidohydrolase [bacterium]